MANLLSAGWQWWCPGSPSVPPPAPPEVVPSLSGPSRLASSRVSSSEPWGPGAWRGRGTWWGRWGGRGRAWCAASTTRAGRSSTPSSGPWWPARSSSGGSAATPTVWRLSTTRSTSPAVTPPREPSGCLRTWLEQSTTARSDYYTLVVTLVVTCYVSVHVRRVGGGQRSLPVVWEDQHTDLQVSAQSEESLQESCEEEPGGKKEIQRAGEKTLGSSGGSENARANQVFGLQRIRIILNLSHSFFQFPTINIELPKALDSWLISFSWLYLSLCCHIVYSDFKYTIKHIKHHQFT